MHSWFSIVMSDLIKSRNVDADSMKTNSHSRDPLKCQITKTIYDNPVYLNNLLYDV